MNDLASPAAADKAVQLASRLPPGAVPHDERSVLRPDFLVISPPKTGSTWLAANLRLHPQVFVPDIKEVKYFSSFHRWLDLGWYLDHFAPAEGRWKGEASPSYALLPVERIRLVRRLFPDVKLVFLMREPVGRAWSHARHNHRYREANFVARPDGTPVLDAQWRANFIHDWPFSSGDYLGQLRRWSSVFPREQMFVGFYESIAHDPAALLRDLFAFLGVKPDVDLSAFPLTERILPGPPGELSPSLGRFLHRLLHDRAVQLAAFLEKRFDLKPPPEWRAVLDPPAAAPSDDSFPDPLSLRGKFNDADLSRMLGQEATFPLAHRLLVEDHHGYRIVFHRGRLFAVAREAAHVNLLEAGEAELWRWRDEGCCFTASSLAELKEGVIRRVLDRTGSRLRSLEADLRAAREQTALLATRLNETARALDKLGGDALRLSAKEHALVRVLRGAGLALFRLWGRLFAPFASPARKTRLDSAARSMG